LLVAILFPNWVLKTWYSLTLWVILKIMYIYNLLNQHISKYIYLHNTSYNLFL
jgi:hypothetical protein